MKLSITFCSVFFSIVFGLRVEAAVKGFTLTEIGDHVYDASLDPTQKTEAQLIVDRLYRVGVRHINLTPRAVMKDPRSSILYPIAPLTPVAPEHIRYKRMIDYIHAKGMTVGIRPIFFVVDSDGNIPYTEILPSGEEVEYWHGNIQPTQPVQWFNSFLAYIARYIDIAIDNDVEEFTIGAELETMTVGMPGEFPAHPNGFPKQWLRILSYARQELGKNVRIMYDINTTDDVISVGGVSKPGGELSRFEQRIAVDGDKDLIAFWTGLDAIGLDLYRSLVDSKTPIPTDYKKLVQLLEVGADQIALDLHVTIRNIDRGANTQSDVILKELGFRSVTKGFIDPFEHVAGGGTLNVSHQAAAFEAFFRSFYEFPLPWFGGVVFWDASVDLSLHGPFDLGFSPLGKRQTEAIITNYFTK